MEAHSKEIASNRQVNGINLLMQLTKVFSFISATVFLIIGALLLTGNTECILLLEKILELKETSEFVYNETTYTMFVLIYISAIFSFLAAFSFFIIGFLCKRIVEKNRYIKELEEESGYFFLN